MAPEHPLVEWDAIAPWYDEKQGDTGDLWHRALIDPVLLRRIGDVGGRDLLDLGCGNGYLARRFQRAGARVTAVDAAEGMLRAARGWEDRTHLGVRILRAPANDLSALGASTFDLIYANMSLMDIEDAAGAIREVARRLRPSGRFVASFDHPCFGGDAGAAWVAEGSAPPRTVARRVHRYRELFDDPGVWNLPDGRPVATRAYHRPLSWYADRLRESGLAITALDEPSPTPEFLVASPRGEAIATIPVHLVLEAIRLPVRASSGAES